MLPTCATVGSELTLPFTCPPSHIFDVVALTHLADALPTGDGALIPDTDPDPERAAAAATDVRRRQAADMPSAGVRVVEAGYLTNPLTDAAIRRGVVDVHVANDAAAAAARALGGAAIYRGVSDTQVRAALADHSSARVLRLSDAERVFGGWDDHASHDAFEDLLDRSHLLRGSWCCSSWYKPSGSFDFGAPLSTAALLPAECAATKPARGGSPSSRRACSKALQRLLVSEEEARLAYVPALDKAGEDGYYRLIVGNRSSASRGPSG